MLAAFLLRRPSLPSINLNSQNAESILKIVLATGPDQLWAQGESDSHRRTFAHVKLGRRNPAFG